MQSLRTIEDDTHPESVGPSAQDLKNIPVYAKHPQKLVIYNTVIGDWLPTTDADTIVNTSYLAVSYRQTDFPDKIKLGKQVQEVCFQYNLEAYWLDFACTGSSQEEKSQDLYRIADVFRWAAMTLIMIDGQDNGQHSIGWLSWGSRKWTLPEALLSKKFVCKIGSRRPVIMDLRKIANHAYSEDEDENVLIALYDTHGKDFLADFERVDLLCKAIKSRSSGPGPSTNKIEGEFTAYPAEWVYALMGFFLRRIQPTPKKTEKEAFMELLNVNGLECDESGWEGFWRSDGKEKVGIRIKGSRSNDRTTDAELPKYVPAAKFDHGQTVRHACDEGTRTETLAEINRWLRSGNDKSRIDNKVIERVLWLHGFAGSGKSTIAQTAAEEWYREKVLGATFFCSQGITECTIIHNIIPTIAYQLSQINDDFKRKLSEAFMRNRDLQHAKVDLQLEYLIVDPLRAANQLDSYAVVIDALDELNDKQSVSTILKALDKHRLNLSPLKFFITSRPEDHIYKAFRTLSLSGDTKDYNLNDVHEVEVDRDIRAFLKPRLKTIGYNMPQPWPFPHTLNQLIRKARGLFIFASTAVKFLEDRNLIDLNSQLQLLLETTAPTSNTPYAHLDQLYLQVLRSAFPMQDESTTNILQTIFALLILGMESFSVNKLQDLMLLSPGTVRDTLRHLRSLLAIPDNDYEDIRLIHPSIHDFLTDAKRCIDPRFVVSEAAGHSNISECCLKTLIMHTSANTQMQTSLRAPIRRKQLFLRLHLRYEPLAYPHQYWIFHINKSDGRLNESTLQLLGELASNHCALAVLVEDHYETISVFLDLFVKLLHRPSPPLDITKKVYKAAIFLYWWKWSDYKVDIKEHVYPVIDERRVLKSNHSYNNALYSLDPNFPLLGNAISEFSVFKPRKIVPELKNDIYKLWFGAIGVHELIMHQAIPENENDCSALQQCMFTLYDELESSYETYCDSYLNINEAYTQALCTAISAWIKSLRDFQTEIHKILELPEIIYPSESSESPNSAIIGASEHNWNRTPATISELLNEYNYNDFSVARTLRRYDGRGRSSSSSSLPDGFLPVPTASRHPDEWWSHDSLIAKETLCNSPDTTLPDVYAVNDDNTERDPATSSSAKRSRLSPTAESSVWKRPRTD